MPPTVLARGGLGRGHADGRPFASARMGAAVLFGGLGVGAAGGAGQAFPGQQQRAASGDV